MTPQMERNLREMGILPATLLEDLSDKLYRPCPTLAKGYFNDEGVQPTRSNEHGEQ
jgi:hypothetical protein